MTNELRDLRVTSRNLLKNRLEHLRLLLDELAQLLEMGVIPKEIEVRKGFTTGSSTSTGRTSTTFVPGLGSGFKQVDRLLFTVRGGRGRGSFASGCPGSRGGSSVLLLFLLDVVGDTLNDG